MPHCIMQSTGHCVLMTYCLRVCDFRNYVSEKELNEVSEALAQDVLDEDTPYDPR